MKHLGTKGRYRKALLFLEAGLLLSYVIGVDPSILSSSVLCWNKSAPEIV
jgi:hypothetical protein